MNIDEKIKQDLSSEMDELNRLIAKDEGLFNMIWLSFKGSMKLWMILVNIVTLVATGFLLWTGYEFFTVTEVADKIHWGVCFIVSACAQIALKQWMFMEMNRSSIMRELKRIEMLIHHKE